MKIEQISCTQFAGIRDRTYDFEGGINVLLGKNETGKSTVIDLIYHLLYHNVDVKQSEATEKDFKARYYPKSIGADGDYIDGRISIQTDEGHYTLAKCWGAGAYSKLTTPENTRIQSQATINDIIGRVLQYRRGLYDDVVFAPQRKQEEMISHIFQSVGESKKPSTKGTIDTKADLISIIAQETIRNAGVDANAFERQLNAKIDDFEGSWDTKKDAPKATSLRTKRNGEKPKKEGTLFASAYRIEELTGAAKDARNAELAVDKATKDLAALQNKIGAEEERKEKFEKYATLLSEYNANKSLVEQLKSDIARRKQDAKNYPGLLKALSKASKLRQEYQEAEALELYDSIAELRAKWEEAKERLNGILPIQKSDIDKVSHLESTLQFAKKKQFEMDILAQLYNTGYRDIEIRSISDNRVIMMIEPGKSVRDVDIIEPVEIVVPGVMKLKLSNHTTGFYGKRVTVGSCSEELHSLYYKLGIKSENIDELKAKKEEYDTAVTEVRRLEDIYKTALGGRDWKQMDNTYHTLSKRKKRRPMSSIAEDVQALCGEKSIESFFGEISGAISAIQSHYKDELGEITRETLYKSVAQCEEKLRVANEAVRNAESIPPEYKRIKDIDQYRGQMKEAIDALKGKQASAEATLQENQKYLGKKTAEEYEDDLAAAKLEFNRVHDLYKHWLHIREVFRSVREKLGDATEMKDIEKRFAEYLQIISDGRIVLNSLSDALDVSISSETSRLDEKILSEGTKDTIALAFRLAVLEHVFPKGGAILVLDDPFTDMDSGRTAMACNLVRNFSDKGNQVLFTTCNEDTARKLGGNLIHFT